MAIELSVAAATVATVFPETDPRVAVTVTVPVAVVVKRPPAEIVPVPVPLVRDHVTVDVRFCVELSE